jgi:NADH:ubiquinone oxidoreductase subunit 6 (subunit J)
MRLILFWIFAVPALLAALLAAGHKRPVTGLKALMVMLFLDALELFVLGAPLLGLELMVVSLAGAAAVWGGVARRRLESLGAPGRPRYTLARLAGLLLVILLFHRLTAMIPGQLQETLLGGSGGRAVLGGIAAGMLLGSCAILMVVAFRYRAGEEGTAEK